MYKNQLQELAQRSCFSLPAYTCIREGPDHAPRFKATVSFHGETFESPHYCATLRQAEHSAAEAALNTLSKRGGPSQSLAAKILDETSVCKNLLQETAQRAGVSLPVYTTIRGGAGHLPVFKCIVEVAGRVFVGDPAKSKKQAEKNAAMSAWSAIKKLTQYPAIVDSDRDELGSRAGALTLHRRDNKNTASSNSRIHSVHHHSSNTHNNHNRSYGGGGGRPRVRMVNVRERSNPLSREGSPAASGHFSSVSSSSSGDTNYNGNGRFSSSNQQSGKLHHRSHSLSGLDSSLQEAIAMNKASNASSSSMENAYMSNRLLPPPTPRQTQNQNQNPLHRSLSRLSLQSSSDRFELRRPLIEELQRDGDEEWLDSMSSYSHQHSKGNNNNITNTDQLMNTSSASRLHTGRPLFQSQSERFELKPSLLEELYPRDDEDWWMRGEIMEPMSALDRDRERERERERDRERERSSNYGERDKSVYQIGRSDSDRLANVATLLHHSQPLFQSQSERFELKPSLLDELYQRDDEDWWMRGEPVSGFDRDMSSIYGEQDNSYKYYEGNNSGRFSCESLPYLDNYSNDHASIQASYMSAYGDANNTSYCNFNDSIANNKAMPYAKYSEGSKLHQSSYPGFNEASQKVASYASSKYNDGGGDPSSSSSSSYKFDVESTKGSSFLYDHATITNSAFPGGGYNPSTNSTTSSSSSSNNAMADEQASASSSASIWSRPAQWWTSHVSSNSSTAAMAVVQSLGLRPAASVAPPVRVRQMVAVSSSPPPRTSNAGVNTNHSHARHRRSLQQLSESSAVTSSVSVDVDATTRRLFDRIRL